VMWFTLLLWLILSRMKVMNDTHACILACVRVVHGAVDGKSLFFTVKTYFELSMLHRHKELFWHELHVLKPGLISLDNAI
jgi:hypothetical protein